MQKKIIFYLLASLFLFNFSFINAQTPYKLSWGTDGVLCGAGVATGIPGLIFLLRDDTVAVSKITGLNRNNVFFFDRIALNNYSPKLSDLSDVLLWTTAASPLLLLFSSEIRTDWFKTGFMYAETMVLAAALPEILKGLTPRYRPYSYNPEVPLNEKTNPDASRSFFSGHTTMAFASAVFLSKVYSDVYPDSKYKTYVWGGSLLLAATVGTLRVLSGKHFPTDVLTGAVVGSALGWLIPELHKSDNKDKGTNIGIGMFGINISYAF